jgi:hypothetical protein
MYHKLARCVAPKHSVSGPVYDIVTVQQDFTSLEIGGVIMEDGTKHRPCLCHKRRKKVKEPARKVT